MSDSYVVLWTNDRCKWLRKNGCIDEVAISDERIPIRFDCQITQLALEQLRFRSQRGERGLKYLENGKLKKVISLQGGVYRISPGSAASFEQLLIEQ